MSTRFLLITFASLIIIPFSVQSQKHKTTQGPKLIVGIVVDQMRWDYLYRFNNRYGEKGFKRLLNEGFTCENTYINYVPTVTAIGHSSIYTGSVPAIHGITGNSFIMQQNGKNMYCTEDNTVITVGSTGNAGKMSPQNLLSSTITDELKLSSNFQSKVIGIALKDRGAILPAGHFADAAYWFDDESGNWITSSYYMDKLPEWIIKFNKKNLTAHYLKDNWHTLYKLNTYSQSLTDSNTYEGKYKGSQSAAFPVMTSELIKTIGPGLIRSTPFGNTLTLDLAKEAMINEKLGKNIFGETDFLAISLSSTDYIGHQFAVNSIKVEDAYLRLDQDLGNFFQFLDQRIGKGNYTVFLTSDHGAAHNPKFFSDQKGNSGFFNSGIAQDSLNQILFQKFGENKLIFSMTNSQVHLDNRLINQKQLDELAIRKTIIGYLKNQDGVAFVTDMENAADAAIPELIRERIVNGYNYKRSGIIQIILEPQIFNSTRETGTSHSAWNPYDSRIPLLWMGWGVKHGKTHRPVHITDVAPTIAALLQIQEPNGNIGKPVEELIN